MWQCLCKAIVSDTAYICPVCSAVRKDQDGNPIVASEVEDNPGDTRDAEGYSITERMARRPTAEIANAHLLAMQRARKHSLRKRQGGRKTLFDDAVVPGSLRTSRPIFSSFKH